jgi:hypothetical protein
MQQEDRQDKNEIPGLKPLLVRMASTQNQFVSDLIEAHRLLKEHGLVTDVKLEVKPIPLGDAGELVNSLVVDVHVPAPEPEIKLEGAYLDKGVTANVLDRMAADWQQGIDEIHSSLYAPRLDKENPVLKALSEPGIFDPAVTAGEVEKPLAYQVMDELSEKERLNNPLRLDIIKAMKEHGTWKGREIPESALQYALDIATQRDVATLAVILDITEEAATAFLDVPRNWREWSLTMEVGDVGQHPDQAMVSGIPVEPKYDLLMGVRRDHAPDPEKTAMTTYDQPTEDGQATDMPTPEEDEVEQELPAPIDRVNVVGKFFAPLLRRFLPSTLVYGGTGPDPKFKRFRDDLSTIPMEKLLAWPTGLYRDHDTGNTQLLLNISASQDSSQMILVIPDLYNVGGPTGKPEDLDYFVISAFLVWLQKDMRVHRLDDETDAGVFNATVPVFERLVDTYLTTYFH